MRQSLLAVVAALATHSTSRTEPLSPPGPKPAMKCQVIVVPHGDESPPKTMVFFLNRDGDLLNLDGQPVSYGSVKKLLAKPGRAKELRNIKLVIDDDAITASVIGRSVTKLVECCAGQDGVTVLLCLKSYR